MRERMLSPSQLDAAHAPMIGAHVEEIGAAGGSFAGHDFPSTVVLNLTIRGKTVARPIPATILRRNGKIVANAVGAFRFSEFGIEPFQAALGLLRNDDTFHVYVELVAQRRSEEH